MDRHLCFVGARTHTLGEGSRRRGDFQAHPLELAAHISVDSEARSFAGAGSASNCDLALVQFNSLVDTAQATTPVILADRIYFRYAYGVTKTPISDLPPTALAN